MELKSGLLITSSFYNDYERLKEITRPPDRGLGIQSTVRELPI
jgi:hypothetical protein